MIELELVPQRKALLDGHDNTLDVLLLARAPAAPATSRKRTPLNLSIVIDRSGSMAGRPLEEAKRCAAMIVDGLAPIDRASLVVYSDEPDVLVASQAIGDKGAFRHALAGVETHGMTNLHGGWLTGAEQAAEVQSPEVLSRVLLLSDGMANRGITGTADIARHCAELAAAGVTTSTYGLGNGFNEELMTEMARAGRGNAYYGQTADDLADPFREELDLLSALCARGLCLSLAPMDGVQVKVVNQYPLDAEGYVRLPDVAYGGEAWALLRLTVARSVLEQAGSGDIHLLTASLEYTDLEGRVSQPELVHLRLPRLPVATFEAIAQDEQVLKRAQELRAADLQEEGRMAARAGDWRRVEQVLSQLRELANAHPWLRAAVERLEGYARARELENFSKEARYSSSKMRSRLTGSDENAWSEVEESAKASYLRRKLAQGKAAPRHPDKPK
jgi:Ca-activated chloride channel family protein